MGEWDERERDIHLKLLLYRAYRTPLFETWERNLAIEKRNFFFFFFSIFLNYYNRRGGEKKKKKSANAQSLRDWWYSDESMFSPETSNNVIENRGLIVEASPLLSNFFSEDSNFSKKCRRTF